MLVNVLAKWKDDFTFLNFRNDLIDQHLHIFFLKKNRLIVNMSILDR